MTAAESTVHSVQRAGAALARAFAALPAAFVPLFSTLFLGFAVFYMLSAVYEFVLPILEEGNVTKGLVKGLHTGVVALAVYELSEIVAQEYNHAGRQQPHVVQRVRRGVARFGSVVFVALVVEALILVIKYSQQDMVGFLYYPAAVIASAALLLVALGVFTRLTADQS
jgi:hypothetical protein